MEAEEPVPADAPLGGVLVLDDGLGRVGMGVKERRGLRVRVSKGEDPTYLDAVAVVAAAVLAEPEQPADWGRTCPWTLAQTPLARLRAPVTQDHISALFPFPCSFIAGRVRSERYVIPV